MRAMVHGRGAPLLTDASHAWCALLHARAGRLAEAEVELAQVKHLEQSARSFMIELAPAEVASLRGDAAATLAAAERTLATVAGGSILFRYWGQVDLVPALAEVGLLDRAREVLADTLALIDEYYPDELGGYPRGRLFGLRAWLAHLDGESERADADLLAMWESAGRGAALRPATGLGAPPPAALGRARAGHPRTRAGAGPDRRGAPRRPRAHALPRPPRARGERGGARARGALRRSARTRAAVGCDPGRQAAGELVAAASLRAARALRRAAGRLARGRGGVATPRRRPPRPLPAREPRAAGARGRDLRGALGRPLRLERPAQPPGGGVTHAPAYSTRPGPSAASSRVSIAPTGWPSASATASTPRSSSPRRSSHWG